MHSAKAQIFKSCHCAEYICNQLWQSRFSTGQFGKTQDKVCPLNILQKKKKKRLKTSMKSKQLSPLFLSMEGKAEYWTKTLAGGQALQFICSSTGKIRKTQDLHHFHLGCKTWYTKINCKSNYLSVQSSQMLTTQETATSYFMSTISIFFYTTCAK